MVASEQRRVRAEPNVTPMIDVMLVLLIIFMVVTPVLMNGAAVDPPTAEFLRTHPEQPEDHVLIIDHDGRYVLDRHSVPAAELSARLDSIYAGPVDRILYVRADRDLDYKNVLDALEAAGASGVRVAGLIANPAPFTGEATPRRP